MDFKVGELVGGKYRIVRRIGVGGMGSVYEASHAGLGTPLALKVLLPQLAKVPTVADRFRREAQVSATLRSPHVIRVTDVDQLPDGRPYLVMELLVGEALQQKLEREKRFSREFAVDMGLQILLGLECAHALGVVHRDLKPDNVFLSTEGVGQIAKILDFGIAKVKASPEFQSLTRPGMVMGTPQYMAPEQAFSADQVDVRSDLYSVGVMLYEMLSGALPAKGSVPLAVAQQVIAGQVVPLQELCAGLPQGLLNLIARAMAPDRNGRFDTALDMRRALSAFTGQLSVAGHIAATASLGERSARVLTRAGTEKVPVVSSPRPLGTAEMSNFQGRVAIPSPRPPSPVASPKGAVPVVAAGGTVPLPARAPAKPISGTAEMPQRPEAPSPRVLTPTLSEPQGAARANKRAVWPWLLVGAVLIASAGIGALWLLRLGNDPGPPPPMPSPQRGYVPSKPASSAQRP